MCCRGYRPPHSRQYSAEDSYVWFISLVVATFAILYMLGG